MGTTGQIPSVSQFNNRLLLTINTKLLLTLESFIKEVMNRPLSLSRMIIFLVCILYPLLLSSVLSAQEEDEKDSGGLITIRDITLNSSAGKVSPDIDLGFEWSESYSSSFRFMSAQSSYIDTIPDFSESRISTTTDQQLLNFGVVETMLDVGEEQTLILEAGYRSRDVDILEFGYVHFPVSLGGDWVAFENLVNLKFKNFYFDGLYSYMIDAKTVQLELSAGLRVTPLRSLELQQQIQYKPIVSETGTSSFSGSLPMSSEYNLNLALTIPELLTLKISSITENNPYNYTYKTLGLSDDSSTFILTESDEEAEETTTRTNISIISDHPLLMMETMGSTLRFFIGQETVVLVTKDKKRGTTIEEEIKNTQLGLSAKF
jgi:hypothetical protein